MIGENREAIYNTFWDWFKANEEQLFRIEEDLESRLHELHKRISAVNPLLAFEIKPADPAGKRHFIISADGIAEAFDDVRGLAKSSPGFDRWEVIPFRPRQNILSEIKLQDQSAGKVVAISPSDIKYLMINDPEQGKIGLVIYIPADREISEEMAQRFVYLFLDQAIGEYQVESRLGSVFIAPAGAERYEQARSLEELSEHFDQVMSDFEDSEKQD